MSGISAVVLIPTGPLLSAMQSDTFTPTGNYFVTSLPNVRDSVKYSVTLPHPWLSQDQHLGQRSRLTYVQNVKKNDPPEPKAQEYINSLETIPELIMLFQFTMCLQTDKVILTRAPAVAPI